MSMCGICAMEEIWWYMLSLVNDIFSVSDTGILGKRNSEFSQQELNLRPSLVIISFNLMTCMFDQVVTLLGEITCWSLLGLKGQRAV